MSKNYSRRRINLIKTKMFKYASFLRKKSGLVGVFSMVSAKEMSAVCKPPSGERSKNKI